jgi:hypothetical protein
MTASSGLSRVGTLAIDGSLLTVAGIGSGLVAIAGGLPGMVLEWFTDSGESPGRITIGFSAGVLIRLAGTVALVVMCSYHLPATRKEVAGIILAWYVYLTSVDVAVLAVLLPRSDRPAVTRS